MRDCAGEFGQTAKRKLAGQAPQNKKKTGRNVAERGSFASTKIQHRGRGDKGEDLSKLTRLTNLKKNQGSIRGGEKDPSWK